MFKIKISNYNLKFKVIKAKNNGNIYLEIFKSCVVIAMWNKLNICSVHMSSNITSLKNCSAEKFSAVFQQSY